MHWQRPYPYDNDPTVRLDGDHTGRKSDAERLGGLEIENQFKLRRLLDR
jgi:hypothetical protein